MASASEVVFHVQTKPRKGYFATVSEALKEITSGSNEIVLNILKPKNELGSQNSLGIKELIASGESNFKGSPKNRRHNIQIGLEKIAGAIIMPGEEFSFNDHLGPVEEDQGFLPELVIKKTGTVPELGGGLCQVSSTTFRAAMKAGLPITQRKNHSYAVQYYSPQGTDATIYPGVIDLKFINDTPGAILIWPYLADKDTLHFDFYGTKDDRVVELVKPVTYDRKSDGSMKATWVRNMVKKGKEISETYRSVYLSPALFHKEETFVAATPPATSPVEPV
jgi:vancomycin resistance protein YoaR